jgi:hypothetical protein
MKNVIISLILFSSMLYSEHCNPRKQVWMLDEHSLWTKQVINNLVLYDSLNKPFKWNNSELKLIVMASSLLTDMWDKGKFITTQLYTFPGVVEAVMPFLNQMQKDPNNNTTIIRLIKMGALYTDFFNKYKEQDAFNKYPKGCEDNLSETQGFHFDNLFHYRQIDERWSNITKWVKDNGKNYKTSESIKEWFALMGIIIHAVQDFYCHSNWVLIHANHCRSFNADAIPTWEEFNNTEWRNSHSNYDTRSSELLLQKMKLSDTIISNDEFNVDEKGSVIISGGLQTGNCHNILLDANTCEMLVCGHFNIPADTNYAWIHRHPGQRMSNETSNMKIVFGNYYADKLEYLLAMELTKRATEYWIKHMLDTAIIGKEKQLKVFDALIKNNKKTYCFEDPFTGCPINIKSEILDRLNFINYEK